MRWGRHGVFFSEARHRRRRGIRPWSRLQAADGNGRSPKWFNGGMVLAATAVRATVTEALRVGKTACHGHHFTAIGGPAVKSNRLFVRRAIRHESGPLGRTIGTTIGRYLPRPAFTQIQSGGS